MIQFLMDFLGVDWSYNPTSQGYNSLYQIVVQGAIVISVVLVCWLFSTISKSFFRG